MENIKNYNSPVDVNVAHYRRKGAQRKCKKWRQNWGLEKSSVCQLYQSDFFAAKLLPKMVGNQEEKSSLPFHVLLMGKKAKAILINSH